MPSNKRRRGVPCLSILCGKSKDAAGGAVTSPQEQPKPVSSKPVAPKNAPKPSTPKPKSVASTQQQQESTPSEKKSSRPPSAAAPGATEAAAQQQEPAKTEEPVTSEQAASEEPVKSESTAQQQDASPEPAAAAERPASAPKEEAAPAAAAEEKAAPESVKEEEAPAPEPAKEEAPASEAVKEEEPAKEQEEPSDPAAEESDVTRPQTSDSVWHDALEKPDEEKAAEEKAAAEKAAAEKPAEQKAEEKTEEKAEEKVEEKAEDKAAEETAAEKPVAEEAKEEESVAAEPVAEEKAAPEPAAEEPAVQEEVAPQPAAEAKKPEPVADEPAAPEEATAGPASVETVPVEKAVEQKAAEEPVKEEPAAAVPEPVSKPVEPAPLKSLARVSRHTPKNSLDSKYDVPQTPISPTSIRSDMWQSPTSPMSRKASKYGESPAEYERKKQLKPKLDARWKFSHEISGRLIPGTGAWIEKKPSYKKWIKGKNSVLIIRGPPGSGKTYLCGHIINRIRSETPTAKRVNVAYFFSNPELDAGEDAQCVQKSPRPAAAAAAKPAPGAFFKRVLQTWAYELARRDPVYAMHVDRTLKHVEGAPVEELWNMLFVDYFSKPTNSSAYVVLDGFDDVPSEDIIKFLEMLKKFQKSRGEKSLQILLAARLDGVKTSILEGLPCFEVVQNDIRDDVRLYIDKRLENVTVLGEPENRKKIADEVFSKADSFAYAFFMTEQLRNAKTAAQVKEMIQKSPRGVSEMIHSILAKLDTANDRELRLLNSVLEWIVLFKRDIYLDEIDALFKVNYKYDQGLSVEDTIKEHPSLFRLLDDENNELEQSALPANGEPANPQNRLKEQRRARAHLSTTKATIGQRSMADFFTTDKKRTHKVGVVPEEAELSLAKFCMSVLVDAKEFEKLKTHRIADYAANHFQRHLPATDAKKASREEQRAVGGALAKLLNDPALIGRWTARTQADAAHLRAEFVEDAECTRAMREWLATPNAIPRFDEQNKEWAAKVNMSPADSVFELLRPLAKAMVTQWLETKSRVPAEQQFEFLASYLAKARDESNAENLHIVETDAGTATLRSMPDGKKTAEYVPWLACFFGLEENAVWHLRVAQLLQSRGCLKESRTHFTKALELDADLALASFGLAELHELNDEPEQAEALFAAALDRFEAADELENALFALKRLAAAQQAQDKPEDALRTLRRAFVVHIPYGEAGEQVHYECTAMFLTSLAAAEQFQEVYEVLTRLAAEALPTGETRLAQYVLRDERDPWVTQLLWDHEDVRKIYPKRLAGVLRECLDEAVLQRKKVLVPILRDQLALFCLEEQGGEEEAVQLWEQVLADPHNADPGSVSYRSRTNATRQLSNLYFSRALAAKHAGASTAEHVRAFEKAVAKGADPTLVTYWNAHCSALMAAAWQQVDGQKDKARESFKHFVDLGLEILEDDDPLNDEGGFLLLAETLMTAAHDKNATRAMCLFLQYLFDVGAPVQAQAPRVNGSSGAANEDGTASPRCDSPQEPKDEPVCFVGCDGCSKTLPWDGFQTCRYCKVDMCDDCLGALRAGDLPFRVCHPLHQFFKPTAGYPAPHQLPKGHVMMDDGETVPFKTWVDSMKRKWRR